MKKPAEFDYKFDAFISYKWSEADRRIALSLHRNLESYRPPKSIGSVKRMKVYLDSQEYSAGPNLSDALQTNLKKSRFLIVVCSPEAAISDWVNEEVKYFLSLGRADKILLLLIEGEPQSSFPKPLLPEAGEHVDVKQPLAADIRADSLGASLKKLKNEQLRLIAPILGCSFDDLRQREIQRRTQRQRMVIAIVGTLAALFLSLAVIAESQRRLAEKRLDQAILVSEKMLFDVDERLRRVSGTSHVRKEIAQEVGQMLETLKAEALSNQELRYKQYISHQLRGTIAFRNDNLELAENEFNEALHVIQKLVKETPEAESGLNGVAEVAGGLAEIAMERSQYEIAESFYRLRYETIRKLLSTAPEEPRYLRLHARSLAELGLLAFENQDVPQSIENYTSAIKIVEGLVETYPDSSNFRHDLALLYEGHARVALSQNDVKTILKRRRAALAILEELVKQNPEDPVPLSNLAMLYERFGYMAELSKQLDLAENYYWKSFHSTWPLYLEEPQNAANRRRLAVLYGRLAEVKYQRGEAQDALLYYLLDVEMTRALVKQDTSRELYRQELVSSRQIYAERLLEEKQFSKAIEQYVRLKKNVESLIQLGHLHKESLLAATDALIVLGEQARSSNKIAEAEESFKAALRLALRRKEIDPDTIDVEYDILLGHSNLILVQLAKNDTDAIRLHLKEAENAFKIVSGNKRFRNDEQLPRIRSLIHEAQLFLESY